MKSEQYSFSNKLELIDALISQNYFSDAVDELKKLEKQTSDSWSFISIYKRYKYIDEQKFKELSSKCTSLRVMLIASCKTAKANT